MPSNIIKIEHVDNVWSVVHCSDSMAKNLQDKFTFTPQNAAFMRKKMKWWDGKIRLFKLKTKRIYRGLIPQVVKFVNDSGYDVEMEYQNEELVTDEFLQKEIKSFNSIYELKDYQYESLKQSLNKNRSVIVLPTGSGKSFIIYNLIRCLGLKTLLIVPTIHLCTQMKGDFAEYSKNDTWNAEEEVKVIYSGSEKENVNLKKHHGVVVSTWQSAKLKGDEWFEQFDCVIGDECHTAKAVELTKILEKCINAEYRFGFTGTLDGVDYNEMTITGLFGDVIRLTTTKKLMNEGHLANMKIQCYVLKYNKQSKKEWGSSYIDEMKYLVQKEIRSKFICKLANTLEKNTLILFQFVETHGKPLYEILKEVVDENTKVFYVSGETSPETREKVRKYVENSKEKCIIVASSQVYSTGVNIKNLHNVIFASPSKSRIRNLQSIGRGLRLHEDKDFFRLYDISDDLSRGSVKNPTLHHFIERLKIYNSENFEYSVKQIELEK